MRGQGAGDSSHRSPDSDLRGNKVKKTYGYAGTGTSPLGPSGTVGHPAFVDVGAFSSSTGDSSLEESSHKRESQAAAGVHKKPAARNETQWELSVEDKMQFQDSPKMG